MNKQKLANILALIAIVMLIISNIITPILNKQPSQTFYIKTLLKKQK